MFSEDTALQDTRREINPALEVPAGSALPQTPPDWPVVPGGWIEREYSFDGHRLRLRVPYQPDTLLDDVSVRAANADDDYMPYWAYLWPAAITLSAEILKAPWPRRTRVLELGSGLGLVGIAAMAIGCEVSLTDYDPVSVLVARKNAELNGFEKPIAFTLDWRTPPAETWPVIVGCDITYEQRNHAPVVELLKQNLDPDGVCWLADGGRSVAKEFCRFAQAHGFTVALRDSEGKTIDEPGPHYQLIELRHRTQQHRW